MQDSASAPGGAAPNGDASASSPSPFAWGEGFMDIVAKYERNSERQLYVYGISVSRCASCRHRLQSGATECENCGHVVSTKFLNCMRCSAPNPGLWCFECDAYFCGTCRNEPHVLVFSGSAPAKHNCFPIDGSSGKLLHSGAWSTSLLSLAKTARRSQMILDEDKGRESKAKATQANGISGDAGLSTRMENLRAGEKTSAVEKERKQAAKETSRLSASSRPPPVPVSSNRQAPTPVPVRSSQPMSAQARPSARSRSPSPVLSVAQQTPHLKAQKSPLPSPTRQPPFVPPPPVGPPPPIVPPLLTAAQRALPVRPNIGGEVPSTTPTLSSSRKRKAPTVDAEGIQRDPAGIAPPAPQRAARASTTEDTEASARAQLSAEPDGMSLTARLRQMKDRQYQRSHSGTSSPSTHANGGPAVTSASSNPSAAPPPPPLPPAPARAGGLSQTSMEATHRTMTEQSQLLYPAQPVGHPTTASASATAPTMSVKADPMLDEVLSRPIEAPPAPLVGMPAVAAQVGSSAGLTTQSFSGGFSADAALGAGAEDVLQGAVVDQYDRLNAYVFDLKARLDYLIDAVRRASQQDVTSAAIINTRVNEYRRALRTAEDHRERALANVILFSPSIRTNVRTLSVATLQDISQVIVACHKNSFELAHKIREAKAHQEQLRTAIDMAVSSGDPAQITQLHSLGANITLIDEQIRGQKTDRDRQFQLMFQFSQRLRESVQSAIAAIEMKREALNRGCT